MTPVSHPQLPAKAAPGQLSALELVDLRAAQGLAQPALRFGILGSPVGKSPSPAMHNAAFAAQQLPHNYEAVELSDAAGARAALLDDARFGGASVTIPLKEAMLPLVDELSPAARRIGTRPPPPLAAPSTRR
jgi:pentafunctional AROM polypeptide